MALRQMEPKKFKVGENTFYVRPFPAFKAANLTGELASVLSPLLGILAPMVGDGGDIMNVDAGKVADAMANTNAISGDKVESLMKKLLLGGNVVIVYENEDGETEQSVLDKDIADEVFCGEVEDMFVLCVHVIKMNFGGFFSKAAALSGKEKKAAAKAPRKIL